MKQRVSPTFLVNAIYCSAFVSSFPLKKRAESLVMSLVSLSVKQWTWTLMEQNSNLLVSS